MRIFDSLEKIKKDALTVEASSYRAAAEGYMLQGFEAEQITELLEIDGCGREVAKELAEAASSDTPDKYNQNLIPQTYSDVRDKVDSSIKKANVSKIEEYFCKHSDRRYASVGSHMLVARHNSSRFYAKEVHSEIRPLVEGLIIRNAAIARGNELITADPDEKESLEYELFGVWPVALIQQMDRKQQAEQDLQKAYKES